MKLSTTQFLTQYIGMANIHFRQLSKKYNYHTYITKNKLPSFITQIKIKKEEDYYFYLNEYIGDDFKSQNIYKFRGFFLDYDLDTSIEDIIKEFNPTFIVSSGRGKHLYYIFEEPLTDINIINNLATDIKKWNIKLHKKYGVDKKNPLTAMPRLPGSINFKNKKPVEVLYVNGPKYTKDTLYNVMDIKGVTLTEITTDIKIPTNIPNLQPINIDTLPTTNYFKRWIKSLSDLDNINPKLLKANGTIDISKVFFIAVKKAQAENLDEFTILRILITVPVLKQQIIKRGGLNKYSLGEIYRILAMPMSTTEKQPLKLEFTNTTLQTIYDGTKNIKEIINYIYNQIKHLIAYKYKNVIITANHKTYKDYNQYISDLKNEIQKIEPWENLLKFDITIDTFIPMLNKQAIIKKDEVKTKINTLAHTQYTKYQYILDEYKQLLIDTFKLPYEKIIPLIKPTFYKARKELLPKLIKEKSNYIFNLKGGSK